MIEIFFLMAGGLLMAGMTVGFLLGSKTEDRLWLKEYEKHLRRLRIENNTLIAENNKLKYEREKK